MSGQMHGSHSTGAPRCRQGSGLRVHWYDAYYGKDDFRKWATTFYPLNVGFNTARFPNQLKPVADAVASRRPAIPHVVRA
jgi:hypothetical protein